MFGFGLKKKQPTIGVNIKFPYRLKNPVVLWRPNVLKTVTVYRCYGVYTVTIFTRHFSSNSTQIHQCMRRAEVIDGLERNWREEKRSIDEKSINNRRTVAERATRRAETIDGLKRNERLEQQKTIDGLEQNGREEKLLIDE